MRRVSTSVIILVVYAVVVLLLDFVLPTFFRGTSFYGGYIPFFLFFPFMFRRGLVSGRRNNGNSSGNKQQDDELLNGDYNSSNREATKGPVYDEFGIPVKKIPDRTWYYVGMAAIFAFSIFLLLYRGIIAL